MFVQWCIKGIARQSNLAPTGMSDKEAKDVMLAHEGIVCNWWRNQGTITPIEQRQKLTSNNLDLHVNNYATIMPSGQPFYNSTPFISLAAGCTERNTFLRTNIIHPAKRTALDFATDSGRHDGFLFYCWLIVGLKQAADVDVVAEEVRELNSYRRYSAYQTEGEITAKIIIPSNQIKRCELYAAADGLVKSLRANWANPYFMGPESVTNIRDAF